MRIVALTLLFAACSRAPDYSGCRLVGTWRPIPSDKQMNEWRESEQWREHFASFPGREPVELYASEFSMTFGADGSWYQPLLGVAPIHWRLVKEAGETFTIELSVNGVSTGEADYTFSSDDEMADIDSNGNGMRYRRVK